MSSQAVNREFLQKTSIVLGYEAGHYATESKAMHRSTKSHGISAEERARIAKIKTDLRATHFSLGDSTSSYSTSNTLLDPTGEMEKYTAKLNVHAKKMLRQTSAVLGYEGTSYETTSGNATQWDKQNMMHSIALRENTKKDCDPRKVNFEFGTDAPTYSTNAKEAYVYDRKNIRPAVLAESVKKDLRATHYELGNEPVEYSTSNHMQEYSEEVMKQAKGRMDEATNPWRTNISLTED